MAVSEALRKVTRAPAGEGAEGVRGVTRHIALGAGVLAEVGPWLDRRGWREAPLVVADAHTWEAAGRALCEGLPAATACVLDPRPGDAHLVCEEDAVAHLAERLRARVVPVAVGAGTVNDLVKLASTRAGKGYLVVPTAASMNGYTSTIAAVLSGGVKRTVPAHQPDAVFADLEVLRRAPPIMNRAGFGDLLSKPFSDADWRLSHVVRGVPYDSGPAELLDASYRALLEQAHAIGASDADGVALLIDTLLVSGFSMALAGSSAPASGGEHLVSHYWDMEQHCQDAPLRGLHGTQVGIATRLSAMLFERLAALPEPPARAPGPDPEASTPERLARRHPQLTPAVVAEVSREWRAKQRTGDAWRDELAHLRASWPEIRRVLAESLLPAERITRALREAGCPMRASEIGVGHAHLVRTLCVCRQIRGRYVGLDLMDDLGILQGWADEVARLSEAA